MRMLCRFRVCSLFTAVMITCMFLIGTNGPKADSHRVK